MVNTAQTTRQARTGLDHLLRRIQCEFLEMPGLRLTSRQAQRLWDLDELMCDAVLAALVDVRFLVEADGMYRQRTEPQRARRKGPELLAG